MILTKWTFRASRNYIRNHKVNLVSEECLFMDHLFWFNLSFYLYLYCMFFYRFWLLYIFGISMSTPLPKSDSLKTIIFSIGHYIVCSSFDFLLWRERRVFNNIWVFKDWCRASAHRSADFFLILTHLIT